MNKVGLIICYFLFCNLASAQKIVKKSIVSPNTSLIQIDATRCFQLFLENSDSDEIWVEAVIDGEYRKDLSVNIKEEGTTIIISAGFQPSFVNPNDKLSAHKVVSISLYIRVPMYNDVSINGTSSNVTLNGVYKDVHITLNDGRCILNNISENAHVLTQSGDIEVTSSKALIKAKTKYGKIFEEPIPIGNNQFDLVSVTGNITIMKTD